MTPAHRIRLHGFWEVTPLPDGRVRHRRRFGRPRIAGPAETVWVAGDPVPGAAEVSLNDEPLGRVEPGQPFAFDVTSRLNPRNDLTLDVSAAADAPLGEVRVEIRS